MLSALSPLTRRTARGGLRTSRSGGDHPAAPARLSWRRRGSAALATAGVAALLTGVIAPTGATGAGGSLLASTAATYRAAAAAVAASGTGVLLPNGRRVTPAGSSYDPSRRPGGAAFNLGDFPLGLALSPDGRLAVAVDNGYGFGVNVGFNSFCESGQQKAGTACPGVATKYLDNTKIHTFDERLDVIDLASGTLTQAVAVPTSYRADNTSTTAGCDAKLYNCFGDGVVFSPDGRHVYAAGGGADTVDQFTVVGSTLQLSHVVAIPSAAATLSRNRNDATPVVGGFRGGIRGLSVTPDGSTLVALSEFDSAIATISLTGAAPTLTGVATLPGGAVGPSPVAYLVASVTTNSTAYVTAQGLGTVYTVPLAAVAATGVPATASPTALAALSPAVAVPTVLPGADHPTGIALAPDGSRLLVADANSDDATVLPLTAALPTVARAVRVPLSVLPGRTGHGSVPDAVAWSADSRHAYVALAGDDAVAVLDTTAATPTVTGYLPTGWYPTAVAVGRDGMLYTVSAKGLGSRYVAGLDGNPSPPPGATIPTSTYYDGDNMPGLLTRTPVPSGAALATETALAQADVAHAATFDSPLAHSPIPAAPGQPSPITHVVYIVRENRTFDQVFGDLALRRKDVDAAPGLQILAAATPNAHRVAGQFAVADHFFSDGEASVQGHWWTSSANSSDYMEKSWRQYYSTRLRPYDPIGTVVSPPDCSIFSRVAAYQATHPTFTYRNYGELVGFATPTTNASTANTCAGAGPVSGPPSDPNYPTQISLVPDDRGRAKEFLTDSGLTLAGADAGNGNSLRNFNYLILSEDHTSGLAGTNTPRSQVAQNDAGLGQILAGLSHSKYWPSTAVFVVEDDSQDGLDHVDGHRNVLLVASPYTKHVSGDTCVPGYIGHAHYDQASVLLTMERILGLAPLSAYDGGASALYDLFQSKDSATQLTPADLTPFTPAAYPSFIDEKVAALPQTRSTAALRAASAHLDLSRVDAAERQLEAVLWRSVRADPFPAAADDQAAGGLAGIGGAAGLAAATPQARVDLAAAADAASVGSPLASGGALPDALGATPATGALDTGPVTLSTATGLPVTGAVHCAPQAAVHGSVLPGALTLPGQGGGRAAAAGSSTLATTGRSTTWSGVGLVLLGAALALGRRRRPARRARG